MRGRDLNWMQLEEDLQSADRIVLPVGSTEQHAYLTIEGDPETLAALGDGSFGGLYQRSEDDENMVWHAAVDVIRAHLEAWPS